MSAQTTRTTIKEVGVDYITATSHSNSPASAFCSFGSWLVSKEVSRGSKDNTWRVGGYHGRHAGGCAFGVSQQGSIIRASSFCASENWEQLLNLSDNVTRLDIQVTLHVPSGTTLTLSKHHSELKRAPRYRGKPATWKFWYGPTGAEACTVGRRVSDRFGRVYDKGLESGLPEYEGCLRYELELHRGVALSTARRLDATEHQAPVMAHMVHEFMGNRGLRVGRAWLQPAAGDVCAGSNKEFVIAPSYNRSSPETVRVLRWLRNSVQPAIKRLLDQDLDQEVLRALGLETFPELSPNGPSTTFVDYQKWR